MSNVSDESKYVIETRPNWLTRVGAQIAALWIVDAILFLLFVMCMWHVFARVVES